MMIFRTMMLVVLSVFLLVSNGACEQSVPAAGKGGPVSGNLPRLVDLGADKCIPCKMMAPILEELKTTYSGKMDVEFIDVWKSPAEAKRYGVQMIPTQVFYGADGKELFRHQGFMGKKDILARWRELGYSFGTE